jgi:excisionase family DNA binding protein
MKPNVMDERCAYDQHKRDQLIDAFRIVGGFIAEILMARIQAPGRKPVEATTASPDRMLYSRTEVAEMLGVSPTTITRLRSSRLLVATLVGGKVRFHKDEIDRATRRWTKWDRRPTSK